jgi:hypothetical protein
MQAMLSVGYSARIANGLMHAYKLTQEAGALLDAGHGGGILQDAHRSHWITGGVRYAGQAT